MHQQTPRCVTTLLTLHHLAIGPARAIRRSAPGRTRRYASLVVRMRSLSSTTNRNLDGLAAAPLQTCVAWVYVLFRD